MDPLITIVITSYNYAEFIADAIRSALSQSYRNLEVLILDNGSTDNSLDVIRSFQDDRIRLIARPENIGIQQNHIDGIRQARGEFLSFLSADDIMLPSLVSDVIALRRKYPDVDMVYMSALIMDGEGRVLYYFDHPSFEGAESYTGRNEFPILLTRDSCMYLPTLFFPRSLFDELGPLDDTLEIVLDYEFGIRMASAGKTFAFNSKPGVLIRFHGENRSGVKNFVATGKQLREFCTVLERYTQPRYHQRLAGWGVELSKMVDLKIQEIQNFFPDQYAAQLPDLTSYVNRARNSIATVPAVGEATLRGEGLITVVVPANGRGHLQRALRSLQMQDYQNWEAFVVGDCTFDPSGLIDGMGLSAKVRVFRTRARKGPGGARNAGIGCANGEIICYLDEDNRYEPSYLAAVAKAFTDPSVQVTVGAARLAVVAGNGEELRSIDLEGPLAPDGTVSLVTNSLPLNAVAHRRSCIAENGKFHPTLPLLEDFEFLLRLNRSFGFTPLGAPSCVVVCIDASLIEHYFWGRRSVEGWNEFATILQTVYNACPPRTQLEAEERAKYVATLPQAIQLGVNQANNVDGILSFVLAVSGSRPKVVLT
ncbi:MAG: glycosyltransferase [Candidatus Baltobacteraceae bacterium]